MITPKVLAIIPARGGSKRLPNKNILPLAGKPLIAWTIDSAIDSGVFSKIIVNTDSEDISAVAKQYGATVPFIRPQTLATDSASSIDLIVHTVKWFEAKGEIFSHVVLLQPTSPLRASSDISKAWSLMLEKKVGSVISVCEVEHPVQWTYNMTEQGVMSSLFKEANKRSQDYGKNYRLNGAIYIVDIEFLMKHHKVVDEGCSLGYVMTRKASVDIDEKIDLEFAEFLMMNNINTKSRRR